MSKQNVVSLKKLKAIQAIRRKAKPLKIKVTIPGAAVPLLRAFAAIEDKTPEQWTERAVLNWMKSDDAMTVFDQTFNAMDF